MDGADIGEGALQRMKLVVAAAESADRGDRLALGGPGQGQAAVEGLAVEQHRAGPAIALLAAALDVDEAEVAEGGEQRAMGGDGGPDAAPVDLEGDGLFRGHGGPPQPTWSQAWVNSRRVRASVVWRR